MSSRKKKIWALVALALVAAVAAVGAVRAFLSDSTDPVENTMMVAPHPNMGIQETFGTISSENHNLIKENVCVNVGDPGYAVYVRATIVVTWQDADGNIYWGVPGEDEYTMKLNLTATDASGSTLWFQGSDGFYYFRSALISGATPPLIISCYQIDEPPVPGYTLHVEIMAQTIQAVGRTDEDANGNTVPAVEDVWTAVVVDGSGKLKSAPMT